MEAQILGARMLCRGKFLNLQEITFRDDRGRERRWEAADREGSASASFILARVMPQDELLLIRQFRPPAGRLMLEFPAGLIDPGETPEQTAVRELAEETGYHGKILCSTPPAYSSPGLTGEPITMVEMVVDGDAFAGAEVVPHPEDTESIEVFRVPRRDLAAFVKQQEEAGVGVDSKIYTFLAGMRWAIADSER